MGSLKDIANQPKLQSFPSSQFMIEGDVPASQCSEAKIEGDDATSDRVPNFLFNTAAFTGFALAGKICTITQSAGGNTGDFDITANTNDKLDLLQDPGSAAPVTYYVHDGGSLILTRNLQSFAAFIRTYTDSQGSNTGSVSNGFPILADAGKFPFDLSGIQVEVFNYPPPTPGIYDILSNTINNLTLDRDFTITANDIRYLIRRPISFSHTIKGGKLYTNIPTEKLQNACTILFDPLT